MNLYYYLLFAFILFSGVVYLIYSKKQQSLDNTNDLPNNNTLNSVNKDLIEQIEKYKLQIIGLQKTIKELKLHTNELTNINLSLESEINNLNEKQKKLELLQKKKDDFFSIYVHDLKNPAGTIQNLIELLNSYDLSINEQKEIYGTLFALSKRMIHITNEICRVVVEKELGFDLEIKSANLQDILKKVYIRNIYKAKKKNISVFLNIPENLPVLSLDPDKIENAIENLIDNAIKFSSSDKTVFIEIHKLENFVRLEIRDQGQGLTKEDMENVFQKGAMLSAKPTGDETSSGLGLWIVKRIIEEHKGIVRVESETGIGTKFSFDLPY